MVGMEISLAEGQDVVDLISNSLFQSAAASPRTSTAQQLLPPGLLSIAAAPKARPGRRHSSAALQADLCYTAATEAAP